MPHNPSPIDVKLADVGINSVVEMTTGAVLVDVTDLGPIWIPKAVIDNLRDILHAHSTKDSNVDTIYLHHSWALKEGLVEE